MHEETDALRAELGQISTFEDAARTTLDFTLRTAERALAESRYARTGRILRCMLHLRSDEGYEGIVIREQDEAQDGGPAGFLLRPSSTAWDWVRRTGDGVYLDVLMARLTPMAGAPQELVGWISRGGVSSSDTARRMMARNANLLCALPLKAEDGRTVGMVSLEAACLPASGRPFIWESCADTLRRIAEVASQEVLQKPRAASPPAVDELLPVVGQSMVDRVETLGFFAESSETILLSGATGTGKSRIARWCHARSGRAKGPFEHMDLMTTPRELQAAHLFGWRRGAFTGAVDDRLGAVSLAQGGTLFIDEIDKLSLDAQAALLQLLDSRTFRPVGDTREPTVADVRFIVGTNADLRKAVASGRFREDLFFRINVLPVTMPPLIERRDEITLWAQYMLEQRHQAEGAEGLTHITPAAERALLSYTWPGNLRQLDNVVRRAYTYARMRSRRAPTTELALDAPDVLSCLASEPEATLEGRVESQVQLLASAWVDLCARAQAQGVELPLELLDAVQGAALEEACARTESLDAALILLGRSGTVTSRNQQKYKQTRDAWGEALRRALEALKSGSDNEGT